MENELVPRRGRPPKMADEVKSNLDIESNEVPSVEQENVNLHEENSRLRGDLGAVIDRLSRLEAVSSSAKLRKYDEMNDPAALLKIGHILSTDGKDPILYLRKTGEVVENADGSFVDGQMLHGQTLSGQDVKFTLKQMMSLCSGNSIPCQVNNYQEYREKEAEIMEKRHLFQRSNGKTSRINTVDLRNEIRQLEEDLRMSVTLSLDLGKSFTGATVDIHPVTVFNAVA